MADNLTHFWQSLQYAASGFNSEMRESASRVAFLSSSFETRLWPPSTADVAAIETLSSSAASSAALPSWSPLGLLGLRHAIGFVALLSYYSELTFQQRFLCTASYARARAA